MKARSILKNILTALALLALATLLGYPLKLLDVEEHVTTVFVFAVFMISLLTDGYVYGLVSAAVGTLAINYIFTFPYLAFDFITPVNLVSAAVMALISVLTSALTTKLKRYLKAREDAERERMHANLLRAVSHDLRSPLTTIYSAAATLMTKNDKLGDAERETMLRNICEDSEWLIRMVENLLSVTRLDSGEVSLEKTSVVVDELVDSAMTKFLMRHPNAHVDIELCDEPVFVSVDSLLVEQVIINLLENAQLHAKSMTQLSLSVSAVGENAVFEVADDGCGISEDILHRLFHGGLAVRHDISDSSKRSAGIGLTLCASIIKAHGGEISAENRKSGGALFRFTLKKEDTDIGE